MIYVFLANGFEEVEALTPIDMLRRCELQVVTVGIGDNAVIGSHNVPVLADINDSQINLNDDLDMIILPGGMPGTLNLEKNPNVQKAIDFCLENNKYIAAICAAPSILGHRRILDKKEATCYPGFESELGEAIIKDKPVCSADKIITSRGAGTAMEFSFEIIKKLISEERTEILKKSIVY